MILKGIKKIIRGFGFELLKIEKKKVFLKPKNPFSMHSALERCHRRGIRVETVIDVGASNGCWSRECMKIYPKANYLLIEAQKGHQTNLQEFKNSHPNVNYILAAAGEKKGSLYFDESDLFGGLASEEPFEKNNIEVPSIVLDETIKEKGFPSPFLLKLDTHGFELPILEGASEIISKAELIIIETYNYRLTKNSLRYWEMCSYMENLGFLPIENVDFMQRKYDDSFWQMDTFFVRSNNKAFSYCSYS